MKKAPKHEKNVVGTSIPKETRKKITAFDENENAKRLTKRPQ
ncbi:hypothetical protein [Bacillus taeanensis]|nr:hypothetical protein [Bacillus taeanensis]